MDNSVSEETILPCSMLQHGDGNALGLIFSADEHAYVDENAWVAAKRHEIV